MNRCKFARAYSETERALFAEYCEQRSALRPPACIDGEACWVRFGPPCYDAYGNLGNCVGCGGRIKTSDASLRDAAE
jgi:hypothetical protein